jgi:hypothetical protein
MTNYLTRSVYNRRPYETWNTPMYPGYPKDALNQLESKGYYVQDDSMNMDTLMYLFKIDEIMEKLKGFEVFISEIVDEHFEMTKTVDNNLNYLWFLYKRGTKAGEYKPFILMAEMQLLKETGYITAEEIENMWNMLNSEDRDNFNLVYLAMKTLRSTRVKELGAYSEDNSKYAEIQKDYPVKILSQDIFLKPINK